MLFREIIAVVLRNVGTYMVNTSDGEHAELPY
jgi:hypothetical protein